MKLSTWAKINGLDYQTAWHLFKNGNLPVKAIQLKTGTILIKEDQPMVDDKTVLYCRVSNHSRKKELEYQVDRCNQFCLSNGWSINSTYKEIASGMNDNRKVLWKMLSSKPTRIVVENKDRLTRFGFLYLKKLLKEQNCDIIVINETQEDDKDLLKDLTSVIYSFCARLYGMRRAKNKTDKCKLIISEN